ncbi:hypothetical protein JOL79_11495 [Microbispora sp. RL4-1S]|uniref:Uncharacterized protein n=1 Tax=Microbispora oryzae TaxID=2806554 RepID=A0A940WGN0_9ACTN|nr:hypothetical protein [Microbispora oryzae]MBP2704438.1 hypothetical protein [Microbispora oryzae]
MGDQRLPDCPDCGVTPGAPHHLGCDVARCPVCGFQRLTCHAHEGAELFSIWTGRWPGKDECERFGWWAYFVPYEGFIPCPPDHSEAVLDLNRLYQEAAQGRLTWDINRQQFVPTAAGGRHG